MTKKILLATGLLTSALWADFTLEYKMEGNMKQVVQYKDAQHVLITTGSSGEKGAQLIVGEKRYMVMNRGGKKKYMDMDVMMEQMKQMSAAFGGMPEESEQEKNTESDFKVIKKGKSKTVAGVKGQIWTIEFEEEGKKERLDIVVTDDDKVVDAIHKYLAVMKQFTQMGGEEDDGLSSILNIAKGYVTIGFDGMELVKFDDADIPDSVYALQKGMAVDTTSGKTVTATVKKPPLCAITGKVGEAKQLSSMLKPSANGWKQLSSAMCLNMMKMTVENAIYQKGDSYIHINLSINVEDEKGIVATYRTNNMEITDHKKGKIQGNRYQSAYLKMAKQNAIDIRLNNAMLTMSATGSEKVDLASFADNVLDLSKFVPVKKSKATADDALKSLGALFGGGGSSKSSGTNPKDAKAAEEMLKGLFGK